MSLRSPAIDLLLKGGELLALSKLDYERLRADMLAVLSDRRRDYTHHTHDDPGVAIVEALAACLDVIAFYHDRTLTESKLGSAQLAESAARLVAVIGYRPSPSIAAGAWQFFEAAVAGTVEKDVRVSGRGGDPPENVVFATSARVDILPAFNGMPLSPLLTQQAGAQRVLITGNAASVAPPPAAGDPESVATEAVSSPAAQPRAKRGDRALGGGSGSRLHRGEATTLPDFRPDTLAMIVGREALELASVNESRRGGIALEQPLLRSYDAQSTNVAPATQVRRLRFWGYLGGDDLVVFEVTDRPILGMPDPDDASKLTSTLELFVFEKTEVPTPDAPDPGAPAPDVPRPEDWDAKAAWTKVVDFSASEASDRHYRTFVDDRLTTYVILRRKLGYRDILRPELLDRVYARFVSAIGRVGPPDDPLVAGLLDLSHATLKLDEEYFETSLVRPKGVGQPFQNRAGWAITKEDMGLAAGKQVAILGAESGKTYFRTLAVAEGRYLKWKGATDPTDPAGAHDPIDDVFDVAKTTIARLDEVGHGLQYPLLESFYRQVQPREPGETALLKKGTSYLCLENASTAKVGDYLLVGCRRKGPAGPGETRWLLAEVAQIAAVQGNLIRLKDPIEQDYGESDGTELVVVPRVASVYYGDYFVRTVPLNSARTFVSVGPSPTQVATSVALDTPIKDPALLREQLGWSGLSDEDMLDKLFLAVAGQTKAVEQLAWDYGICIPSRGLTAEHLEGLRLDGRTLALRPGQPTADAAGNLRFELTNGRDASAVQGRSADQPLVVTVKRSAAPTWSPVPSQAPDPQPGELRVQSDPGWSLVPGETPPIAEALFEGGGYIYLETGVYRCRLVRSADGVPTMFHLEDLSPSAPSPDTRPPIDALAVSAERTFAVRELRWSADWSVPVAATTFPRSAVWLPLASEGVLDVVHGGAATPLGFTKADDGTLLVRDASITIGQPNAAGPLAGATQVWVLPSWPRKCDQAVALATVDAVWRFPIGDDAARAPDQWNDWIVATTPSGSFVLTTTAMDRTAQAVSLTAWLGADGLDLRGATAFHAFDKEPVQAKAQLALRLEGALPDAAPQDASGSVAYTLKRDPASVKHAPFWWDEETKALRIFPVLTPIERQLSTQIFHQIVEVHPTPVVTQPPADGAPTRREFDLPPGWPEGRSPAQLLLVTRTSDGRDEIVAAEVHVTGTRGWFLVGDRNVPASWKTVKLVRNDWSGPPERTATIEHLVRIDGAPPPPWVLGARLSVLFATFVKQAPRVAHLREGAQPIEVVLRSEQDGYLLAPADARQAFPEGGEKHCYLARYSVAGVAPQGTTSMHLGSLPDQTGGLRVAGIQGPGGFASFPISALGPEGDGWRVEIGATGPESIGDGSAETITVRFAYDVSTQGTASKCLLMRAQLRPEDLQSAGVDDSHAVNWVVLHSDHAAGDAHPFALGRAPGQIKLPIDDVARVFDGAGAPLFTSLSFAQLWPGLDETHLRLQGLLVALGPVAPGFGPLELVEGDELVLGDDAPVVVKVGIAARGVLSLGLQPRPTVIRLGGLLASRADLSLGVSFKDPPADQAPWLLALASDIHPDKSISAALLAVAPGSKVANGMRRVPLHPKMLPTASAAESDGATLVYYENQRASQIGELYLATFAGLDPRDNILKSTGAIKSLIVLDKAPLFPIPPKDPPPVPSGTDAPPRVLICSTDLSIAESGCFESGTGERTKYALYLPIFSQSIAFSSGDFIPVTGTLPLRDERIIRTALRVSVTDEKGKRWTVSYRADLSTLLETLTSASDVRTVIASEKQKQKHPATPTAPLLFYSFNKAPGGTFTLNFLFVQDEQDNLGPEPVVEVCVEFGAAPKSDTDPSYLGETKLLPIDLTKHLFLLDTAGLQVDKYLFLHTPKGIFWTRVTGVTGAIVEIQPSLAPLGDRDAYRNYLVYGYAKPASPMALDKDYYALAKSTLSALQLPLGDRVPLERGALLDALIPGDRLLIWDENRRTAWFDHRTHAQGDDHWTEWPDYQYEAVVKRVDWDSGLVLLTEPLPARFLVSFALTPGAGPTPDPGAAPIPDPGTAPTPEPDTAPTPVPHTAPAVMLDPGSFSVRVLPHQGAPFQGARRRIPLGIGDKGRRFARYTGTLDHDTRLATVPLATPKTYASNVEILACDPLSGEWTRWTQFASIDDAKKKDRAVVVGVDISAISAADARSVPFSASFGDGTKGQTLPNGDRNAGPNVFARSTTIGDLEAYLPGRRRLRILGEVETRPVPFTSPRCAKIAPDNLYFEIETGGHWLAPLPPSEGPWRSALEVEIDVGTPGAPTRLREIDEDAQSAGRDGLRLVARRPGVVGVHVYTADQLHAPKSAVRAYEVPDADVWSVDVATYTQLEASDPTRAPGARMLQLLETESLGPHSSLAFSLAGSAPDEIVTVATVDHDRWMVTLESALKRAYAIGRSTIRGNLTQVVQGAAERLTLGSGDGATLGMRLRVYNRAPMLWRDDGAGGDPVPLIEVQVDGKPWSRVDDVAGAGPRDRVYRLDVDADGTVYVTFGDGRAGAVPAPGVNNITAMVRTGKGEAGNVPSIDKLLDGNLAVKSTRSIGAATGGYQGDDAAATRERILARGATLDRIVSIDDAARVAVEVGEVRHARVDPTAKRRKLRMAVALMGWRELTDAVKQTVQARIEERLPATAGVDVEIVVATVTPVMVEVEINASPDRAPGEVLAALRQAFGAAPGGFFDPDRWPIGEPLRLGDLYEEIYAVPGVISARVVQLTKDVPGTPPEVCELVDPGDCGVIRCDDVKGKITFKTAVGGAT